MYYEVIILLVLIGLSLYALSKELDMLVHGDKGGNLIHNGLVITLSVIALTYSTLKLLVGIIF